ncbi:uncharacterized protein C8Q71DRAFT_912070 [Rhodofomes roseus]|uniref:NEDD8-activating enzyme E1 regulatory subunit n=1 Tax=Rhodofomes roseus TaxID=34475 RepID=A0ABQ8JYA7_9APHY|nr:uncharacterized protein C8Q71DRAFT_912070 [Rhodofomes roseus]KAH9829038.1 hypothetical protein C8Q71DRAFT_912070 [Rhodofomes roseus]
MSAVSESQDIEQATAAIEQATAAIQQPDNKTRRYDRQLRLWAASGQNALEASRILVLSSSATATAVLKNLVLPGIGHFTILDSAVTSPADAGNNFFLAGPSSIGKPRAHEAVPLLRELNDSVEGEAVVKDVRELLKTDEGRAFVSGFSLVIAHNLRKDTLDELSKLLWADHSNPPLIAVRSAGFLAEFFIQYHERCVAQPHTDDNVPSLRIIRPFPALSKWASELDFDKLDPTEHGHVPFVIILVRAVEDWKKTHDGKLPSTTPERKAFKEQIAAMRKKIDEENFDEAEAQVWRIWRDPPVPGAIQSLFSLAPPSDSPNAVFHALLQTLNAFVAAPDGPGCLPLSGALPDMRTDTESYVRLQTVYKDWAAVEKAKFKELLQKGFPDLAPTISDEEIDTFVKNAHHVRVLRGRRWSEWDADKEALASSLTISPRETAAHLGLAALSALLNKAPGKRCRTGTSDHASRGCVADGSTVTVDGLRAEVQQLVGQDIELPEDVDTAIGEIARAPTADLPNTAAFLGGMVAQEAIKMITKQYVPVNGYCVIDMVDMWTGTVGGQ